MTRHNRLHGVVFEQKAKLKRKVIYVENPKHRAVVRPWRGWRRGRSYCYGGVDVADDKR
jgi:hypothetical protein